MDSLLSTHLFLYFDLVEDGVLRAIKSAGFDGIEIWAMKPHFPYDNPSEIEKIADEAERVGIEFVTAHMPLYTKVHPPGRPSGLFSPSSPEDSNRALWRKETAAAAKSCAQLGAKIMVTHTGLAFPDPGEKLDLFLDSLDAFIAEDLPDNAMVGLENTPEGSGQVEGLMSVVSSLNSSALGLTIDLGHALMGGNVIEAIEKSRGRLLSIHGHDNDGNEDAHLPPGRGLMPWDEIYDKLADGDSSAPFAWEARDPTGGADHGFRVLKKILEEIKEFERSRTRTP